MPTPAYLTIVGEKQGLISSGASTEGPLVIAGSADARIKYSFRLSVMEFQ
jgi:hypothetical protein